MKNSIITCLQKTRWSHLALSMAIGLSAIALPSNFANAGLTIFPLKIVMEERERFTEIHIFNSGEEVSSFKLDWRFQKQTPSGKYEMIDSTTTPEFDLSKHMVYTPRRVTLQPDGRQTVRLSIRRAGLDVPAGEYRGHLLVQSYAEEAPQSTLEANPDGKQTVVRVFPGYTIPIIYRVGAYDANFKISNVRFNEKGNKLLLRIDRSGVHGSVGSLRAYHVLPGKDPVEVGLKNNVNIFEELDHRDADIELTQTGFSGGQLHIVYNGEGPQAGQVLAETYVPLAN